jgi:hypothetical protein
LGVFCSQERREIEVYVLFFRHPAYVKQSCGRNFSPNAPLVYPRRRDGHTALTEHLRQIGAASEAVD